MLIKKSREKKFQKPMAEFLEPKHILMFSGLLQFSYEGFDKLEEVAKQKHLDDKKYAKYDPDNKDHILTTLFFYIALDVCLKNPVSLFFVQIAFNFHLRVVMTMD